MAKMTITHMKFLQLLLSLVLFVFSMSNAMPISDVHNFCKETFEVEFCMKYIGSDQRLVAARDFSDMLLIPVTLFNVTILISDMSD